jgi:basic amino acid/polyamine antiporter, APA family
MERPCTVRYWRLTGYAALILSVAIACLYLPFSPAALAWPYEWAIVIAWSLLGGLLLLFSGR